MDGFGWLVQGGSGQGSGMTGTRFSNNIVRSVSLPPPPCQLSVLVGCLFQAGSFTCDQAGFTPSILPAPVGRGTAMS